MALGNFTANQGTQTPILTDSIGGGTVAGVVKIDMSGLGSAGNPFQGTVAVSNLATGTLAQLTSGTINMGTVVKGINPFSAGSFTAAGTILQSGSQNDIVSYDLQGTWTGTVFFEGQIGTSNWFGINAISNTSTIGTSTTANGDFFLPSGGYDGIRARLTYSSGTLTYNTRASNFNSQGIYILGGSVTTGVGSVSNIGSMAMLTAGTISMINNGTLGTVTNIGQIYNAGTLQAGTINTGTFQQNPIPTIAGLTYGTHSTTGVSVFGTLAGGTGCGSGTEIFITSLSLSIPSTGGSQDCSIGWGTNGGTFQAGTGLLVRGNFPPGGGIQKIFTQPYPNSGTNGQLCLFQAGAGTVDVSVTYFITASTL